MNPKNIRMIPLSDGFSRDWHLNYPELRRNCFVNIFTITVIRITLKIKISHGDNQIKLFPAKDILTY
jgi:hypothetical protein